MVVYRCLLPAEAGQGTAEEVEDTCAETEVPHQDLGAYFATGKGLSGE